MHSCIWSMKIQILFSLFFCVPNNNPKKSSQIIVLKGLYECVAVYCDVLQRVIVCIYKYKNTYVYTQIRIRIYMNNT